MSDGNFNNPGSVNPADQASGGDSPPNSLDLVPSPDGRNANLLITHQATISHPPHFFYLLDRKFLLL